jgi:hypothetical protein
VKTASEGICDGYKAHRNTPPGQHASLGVFGEGSHTGVLGTRDPGVTTNQGAGVQGDHTSNGPGVFAVSSGGPGLFAVSANGYGGRFKGGKAQLKLEPGSTEGRPGGQHSKGEIYMGAKGALFVCVSGGTPGTWRKVSTTRV